MRAQLCKNCIHEKDRCMCPPNRECSAYVPKKKKESDVIKAYKQLINYHGTDETLTICMEECAELIKEISKYKRATSHGEQIEYRGGLVEEMADVLICLDMLMLIFDITPDEVDRDVRVKMRRNLERIQGGE